MYSNIFMFHSNDANSTLSLFISALMSFKYEIICVLFNIGALQSAVAATQVIETDEGLKLAAKLFQVCCDYQI